MRAFVLPHDNYSSLSCIHVQKDVSNQHSAVRAMLLCCVLEGAAMSTSATPEHLESFTLTMGKQTPAEMAAGDRSIAEPAGSSSAGPESPGQIPEADGAHTRVHHHALRHGRGAQVCTPATTCSPLKMLRLDMVVTV